MQLFGVSIGSLLPWRLARRIRLLTNTVTKITSGNFSVNIPMTENDELGVLGRKINEMATSLAFQADIHKREHGQLEAIINSITEGVIVTDSNGIITLANAAWYRIFGSTPASLGMPTLQSIRVPTLYENILKTLETNLPLEMDFSFDGRYFNASTIRFQSSGINGCVAVVNEVTKLRRLEEIRQQFTANVSHQMKTPLTSILGYSETLLRGAINNSTTAKSFVETIHEQAVALKELIEDVLGLAKIESPTYKSTFTDVDIFEVIQSAIAEFKNDKSITIKLNVPSIVIKSDKKAIEHIIHNLVDNAVKYTPAGGNVEIAAYKDENTISISVSDNGIGIPEQDIDRIFERFYRISGSGRPLKEGTGLGLAIVKHLVEKLNGNVYVESRLGSGSTFTVKLPLNTHQDRLL